MIEIEDRDLTVTIGLSRYDELLDIETRKNVLIEYIRKEECGMIDKANVLRTLGYTAEANSEEERLKAEFEKWRGQHEN